MSSGLRTTPLLLLSTLLVLGATSCGSGGESHGPGGDDARPVRIEVLAPLEERGRIEAAGELVARDRIEVATKVAGRILELPVAEGSVVRRGQVLVRLDSPELHSALAQSEAAAEAARLNSEISARQAERFRRLAAGDVVTQRDLEMTEVAAAAAEAAYAQARAMADMSRQNLDYAILRAPRDGVVVRRMADLGDLALPGMPVLVMEDPGDLEIRVTVPVEVGRSIARGDSALLVTSHGDGSPVAGSVDRVSPSADGHTILAYLDAPGLRAPSGTFVRVTLFTPGTEPALRVPEAAMIRRGPLTGAFIARDGRAVLRWLRLTADGRVAAGLSPGDSLIASPPADLHDGDRVEAGR